MWPSILRATIFVFPIVFSYSAPASMTIKNGKVDINVSGYYSGEDAGSVSLALSYADSAKTLVNLRGSIRTDGHVKQISETLPISQLSLITISAIGANGASGRDGSNGYDGSSGWSGSSGCPPSDGSSGSDGSDATDGENGQDGGDGGDIRISAPADQSELLLLVRAETEPGSGGSGGRGGTGGHGGTGGSGGSNSCRDEDGKWIGGPNGMDGANGRDGRNGSDGWDGRSGRDGSLSFDLTGATGTKTYSRPFSVSVQVLKATDDNEDTVLEPGEDLHITELQISNDGPMPTPLGQILNFNFQNTSSLIIKNASPFALNEVIPGRSTKTIQFPKGAIVLQVPKQTSLIGKTAVLALNMKINSLSSQATAGSKFTVRWRVGLSAVTNVIDTYFASAKIANFTVKNIGTHEVGKGTNHPIEVEFSWKSPNIPGSDVSVTIGNGQSFSLEKSYTVSDLTIPAKGSLAQALNVRVRNSKSLLLGEGNLSITLKLKNSTGENIADSSQTRFLLRTDLRPVAISHQFALAPLNIRCSFPNSLSRSADLVRLEIAKSKGADRLKVRLTTKGLFQNDVSPIYTVSAYDFVPFSKKISGKPKQADVISFLNKLVAAETKKGEKSWAIGSCGPIPK